LEGFLAISGVSSMPALDVLQEQEGLEASGVIWNGGNDLADGIALCSYFECVLECLLRGVRFGCRPDVINYAEERA
jgi:hypothetical protein